MLESGLGFWISAIFGIGIIVANVPEGLLPTVTLSWLAMSVCGWPSVKALVKHLLLRRNARLHHSDLHR